jgi:hypothetical protein
MMPTQDYVQSARPGAFWFYAGAAPRPRDYQMLIMPFTFFWRMLLAKNRHQGLEAKAS